MAKSPGAFEALGKELLNTEIAILPNLGPGPWKLFVQRRLLQKLPRDKLNPSFSSQGVAASPN